MTIDTSPIKGNPDIWMNWDQSDPYGSAMSLWFDCAEFLEFELGECAPDRWEFRASPIQTEIEPENQLIGLDLSAADIIAIGDVCQAVSEACKRKGLDY